MNVSTLSNIVVIVLCAGVLVQVTRMIIAFRLFQQSDIRQTVAALDHATERASAALSEFRQALASEAAANDRSLAAGEVLRDELSVMVGVGNSIADRIMEAAAIVAPATWDVVPGAAADEQDVGEASGRRGGRRSVQAEAA